MNGLGRRQRNMLVSMRLYGRRGGWPERWRLRGEDRSVLETLQARGFVTSSDRQAALTKTGAIVAMELAAGMSTRLWEQSKLVNELRSTELQPAKSA